MTRRGGALDARIASEDCAHRRINEAIASIDRRLAQK
jgi:hypothetical protein